MKRDYPDRPIVGVGVVVLRGDKLLLIRRGKPPRLGQWSLPGGAQNLGETVEMAGRREVAEEAGLLLERIDLLTVVDLVERDAENRVRYHYTLVDLVAEAGEGEAVPGDDAAAIGWFARSDIDGLGLWSETVRIIDMALERRAMWR